MTKIAIIGAGISGLYSAYELSKRFDVTLFEKNDYLGGHANTVSIDYDGKKIDVDTGFIVYNLRTYFHLKRFFEKLEVKIAKSNMSFGIKDLDGGLEYSGNSLAALFAQKKNLLNFGFLSMLKDIAKFNKNASKLISDDRVDENITLQQFVDDGKYGQYFQEKYLLPMAAAIWFT